MIKEGLKIAGLIGALLLPQVSNALLINSIDVDDSGSVTFSITNNDLFAYTDVEIQTPFESGSQAFLGGDSPENWTQEFISRDVLLPNGFNGSLYSLYTSLPGTEMQIGNTELFSILVNLGRIDAPTLTDYLSQNATVFAVTAYSNGGNISANYNIGSEQEPEEAGKVPAPATFGLFCLGVLGIGATRKRKA